MKALRTRAVAVTTTALLAGGLVLATAPAASAEVEKVKRGDCTKSSTWKLELEKDDGQIDIDFDGHTKRAGKTWKYKVKQDGVVRHSGRTVTETDGEFDVDKDVKDRSGKDTIVVRAESLASGEVCKARMSI